MDAVEKYIDGFTGKTKDYLRQMRQLVLENAPEAEESLSYGMPAYKLNRKPLVYFGGYDKHIGFYATPSGHSTFTQKLAAYKQGKGSVQFPLDQPLPLQLVGEIVRFRVQENLK